MKDGTVRRFKRLVDRERGLRVLKARLYDLRTAYDKRGKRRDKFDVEGLPKRI